MSASSPESPVNETDLFGVDTGTPPPTSNGLQPRNISEQSFIIITSVLTATLILAIFIGVIHFVRCRHRRQEDEKHQQRDIEQSLQQARRPVLTIDTDLPRATDFMRPAGKATLPDLPIYSGAPPVPLVQVRTAPPTMHSSEMSALGPMRAHNATRNPLGSHPPGVAGRDTMSHVYQDSTFEEMNLRKFMQTHPHGMRAVYNM